MDRINTHPSAEKLQIKFHNLNTHKHTQSAGKKVDLSELQQEFSIRDDSSDMAHEFEVRYEQFLNSISGKTVK